jgi:hypothetical protein
VNYGRGPQKYPRKLPHETGISKIQCYDRAIGEHPDERFGWRAGYSHGDQGDPSHARDWDCDSGKLLTEQQLTNQRWSASPVTASAIEAKTSTFFITPTA